MSLYSTPADATEGKGKQPLRTTIRFSITDKVSLLFSFSFRHDRPWRHLVISLTHSLTHSLPLVPSGPAFISLSLSFFHNFQVGALDEVLVEIKKQGVSLQRIESRPSLESDSDYDFFMEFNALPDVAASLSDSLKKLVKHTSLVSSNSNGIDCCPPFILLSLVLSRPLVLSPSLPLSLSYPFSLSASLFLSLLLSSSSLVSQEAR